MRATAVILLITVALAGWAGLAYGQYPPPTPIPCDSPAGNDSPEGMAEEMGTPKFTGRNRL